VAAAGKTVIFIPLPTAADDHQTKNAEALAKADAGVVMPQSQMTPEKLAATIVDLFSDRAKLQAMSENARRMSHADAAGRVAEIAVGLIKK
jgi:UDP-N-acetylglucosamine--N-acetylmuramyl-(pentapeptide) pyrophosphoryl-undecaprenol N-acetylglucosamine transferase